LDSSGSGHRPVAGCCESVNERWGSIKGGEFLEQLSDCQLLKKDCVPSFPSPILTELSLIRYPCRH
jgi:hypothetical protein